MYTMFNELNFDEWFTFVATNVSAFMSTEYGPYSNNNLL